MIRRTFQKLRLVWLLSPAIVAIGWSVWPSAQAFYAYTILKSDSKQYAASVTGLAALNLRRQIQQFFSKHDIHIPMEDIVIQSDAQSYGVRALELNANACVDGHLTIWLPLRVRLPLVGHVVWERCLKVS